MSLSILMEFSYLKTTIETIREKPQTGWLKPSFANHRPSQAVHFNQLTMATLKP